MEYDPALVGIPVNSCLPRFRRPIVPPCPPARGPELDRVSLESCMRPVKSDRTPARSRSRRTYARSSRVQAHDRRLLALERLEVRSMLAS